MVAKLFVASTVLVAASALNAAVNLGVAGEYNEFILGSSTRLNTNAPGKVAVGGAASFTNFTIGSGLTTSTTNLVVGGSLTAHSATVTGSIISGGASTYTNPTVNGNFYSNSSLTLGMGGTVNGNIVTAGVFTPVNTTISGTVSTGTRPLPIDFDSEATYLKALSLAQVNGADPTPIAQYSQLYFTGGTGTTYFNVTGDQLAAATGGFHFNAPAGSNIVVNVSGSGFTIPNTGFGFNGGLTASGLLFNFYEATSLTIAGSSRGSYLAPLTSVATNYGDFHGNLIAGSLTGSISYGSAVTPMPVTCEQSKYRNLHRSAC